MSEYEEIKAAIYEVLRENGVAVEQPVNIFMIGVPLCGTNRFTQDAVVSSLFAMETEGAIKLIDGNRFRLLRPLP